MMKLNIDVVLPALLAILVIGGIGGSMYREHYNPIVCKEAKTVDKILAVKYREAAIQFTDGTVALVSQETLQPGDKYCVRRGRKND